MGRHEIFTDYLSIWREFRSFLVIDSLRVRPLFFIKLLLTACMYIIVKYVVRYCNDFVPYPPGFVLLEDYRTRYFFSTSKGFFFNLVFFVSKYLA